MLSRYRVFSLLRLDQAKIRPIPSSHSYHNATAKFTNIDPKGTPISSETGIMVGEPNESYIYIEPEVGNAIRSSIIGQLGSGVVGHSETLSLQFHHDSCHFAHSKCD